MLRVLVLVPGTTEVPSLWLKRLRVYLHPSHPGGAPGAVLRAPPGRFSRKTPVKQGWGGTRGGTSISPQDDKLTVGEIPPPSSSYH